MVYSISPVMNPTHNNPVAAAPSVPSALAPPQPHRPSTSCDRHPEERFTGFCPSCLFDRLSVLDIHSTVASSSSKKPPSSSAAALKSIFKPSSSSSVSSLFPELRRTKSFSARKNEALLSSGGFEPQRRSCDVRVRNTLWSLFNEDSIKEGALTVTEGTLTVKEGTLRANREIGLETRKPINCGNLKEQRSVIDEIVEEEEEEEETEKEKAKEHTEMMNPPQTTTTKKPTRSFWSAASVLSKKLQKWRQKQKLKKHRSGAALPVEKSAVRQLRDTQSEVAEYGYGRRSCDTDPRFSIDAGRFSLDAGRVSVDDPRYSFDEPRASFDGYMIGRTAAAAPPRVPSMLAVVEDSPVRNQVPVEEEPPPPPRTPPETVVVPGGSEQTREYYNDSSSRRRKSLDRSSSTRKLSASIISEIDELKLSGSNTTKVSPHRDREVKDSTLHSRSHSSSVRGDCSVENVEMGGRENAGTVESSKRDTKKSKRWSWNIFGLLHRKNGNKCEDEEEEEGRSGVDRTFSGSWNVEARNGFDPKMMRSNSSVSWRSSATGGFQRNSVDGYVSGKKKKVSSSSSVGRNVENGMLKFNITPSKGRRRGSMDSTSRPVPAAHPLARDVMNFY